MRNYFADERNFACVDGDGRHAYADEQRAVALDSLQRFRQDLQTIL